MRVLIFILAAFVLASCTVAPPMPDVRMESFDSPGKFKQISDFKGKVVMLDFWATWCGPCREAMPATEKLYKTLHPQGFEVLAITTEDRAVVEKFFGKNSPPYPIYLDGDTSVNKTLGITEYPTALILDRAGEVVFAGHPEDPKMREAIQKALG